MRPQHEYDEVVRWIQWGMNDCQIARVTGLPRRTIHDWRNKPRALKARSVEGCPPCSHLPFDDEERYAYLLGVYLGDGCLSEYPRGVFRLRVTLDQRYPGIIQECRSAIDGIKPAGAPAYVQQRVGCVEVGAYWRHWPCLFPQHGKGPKHLRKIELVSWQQAIVSRHPAGLIRGLIQSDGWRGTNNVTVRGKRYAYPRYQFVSYSLDIQRIFCLACAELVVAWRQMKWNAISIARRGDVEKLDRLVGPKK